MISAMRRVQVHLPAALDDAAAAAAARRGISKAALVREALESILANEPATSADPWSDMIGWLDGDPADDIDEVIYGTGTGEVR